MLNNLWLPLNSNLQERHVTTMVITMKTISASHLAATPCPGKNRNSLVVLEVVHWYIMTVN